VKLGLDGAAHDLGQFISRRVGVVVQSQLNSAKIKSNRKTALQAAVTKATKDAARIAVESWETVWLSIPRAVEFCPGQSSCVSVSTTSAIKSYRVKINQLNTLGLNLIKIYTNLPGASNGKKLRQQLSDLVKTANDRAIELEKAVTDIQTAEAQAGGCPTS